MFLYLVLTLILSVVLIRAADNIIIALRRLSKLTRFGTLTLVTVVFALASSFPELFIGITSALNNSSALSLGNILGANIINLSWIVGVAGLFGGVIKIKSGDYVNREFIMAFIGGAAPFLLLWDKELSRVDGLILLILYCAFASGLFQKRFSEIGLAHKESPSWHLFLREVETDEGHIRKELARFFLSIAAILIAADFLVKVASGLALDLGIPIFIIGLILVSIGTTLPELIFAIRSVKRGDPTLVIGNALGTIVVNSTLILGLVALISPIHIAQRREYFIAVATLAIVMCLFWFFTRTKGRLERWEALILLLVYFTFFLLTLTGFNPAKYILP